MPKYIVTLMADLGSPSRCIKFSAKSDKKADKKAKKIAKRTKSFYSELFRTKQIEGDFDQN
ncbi:hypothetical protein ACFL6I_24260 [candidate division KSB1 bacterium]